MRVIAGAFGGRRLVAPRGRDVRPTSDRVRGAIANMIEAGWGLQGASVADVCCGTGALGIEALSRGAAHVTFVDHHRVSVAATTANLEGLGVATRGGPVSVVQRDADQWAAGLAPGERFDVVLVDPPYAWDGWDRFLAALAGRAGVVMVESAAAVAHPQWTVVKTKTYGGTTVSLLEPR